MTREEWQIEAKAIKVLIAELGPDQEKWDLVKGADVVRRLLIGTGEELKHYAQGPSPCSHLSCQLVVLQIFLGEMLLRLPIAMDWLESLAERARDKEGPDAKGVH